MCILQSSFFPEPHGSDLFNKEGQSLCSPSDSHPLCWLLKHNNNNKKASNIYFTLLCISIALWKVEKNGGIRLLHLPPRRISRYLFKFFSQWFSLSMYVLVQFLTKIKLCYLCIIFCFLSLYFPHDALIGVMECLVETGAPRAEIVAITSGLNILK